MSRYLAAALLGTIALASCHRSRAGTTGTGDGLALIGPPPGPRIVDSMPDNPFAYDRIAIAQGYQYFRTFNCYGCHGDHGGGGMGPSLRDSTWLYGGRDAQIFASIYQGRDRGMPAWGNRLSREQIWKVVSYITSMRTANEQDPPH